jgi:hypothetical protein
MNFREVIVRTRAAMLVCVMLSLQLQTASAADADDSDLAELKRAIKELQAENRELANRLKALETEKPDRATAAPVKPAPATEKSEAQPQAAESKEPLEQRVKELELAKAGQERATRLIIQDSLGKLGSKINEAVVLGGAIEMLAGRSNDPGSPARNVLKFNTAELDLEIQVNPWTLGSFIIGYDDGQGTTLFQTNKGHFGSIDRINLDRAYVTVGDLTKFPFYVRAGRMTLPFGISTGVHRTDVLTVENPLTIDGFETRKNAIGLGFGFPTPQTTRPPPPVFGPRVNPLLVNPLISSFAEGIMGYKPLPARPKAPAPSIPPPLLPPFFGSVYLYDSSDTGITNRNFNRNVVGRLGYRANGNCGRNFDQLSTDIGFCPWALDANVDYNSSIFDSRFLENEYRSFVGQFDRVRGMAGNVKLSLGPLSVVTEWNGATKTAVFTDDARKRVNIRPSASQISVGYQFDWNPWIESIGAQGTFLAVGYSKSRDLAGVTQLIETVPTRVGFLPKTRTTLTLGEWVLDGVKLVVELSRTRDYSRSEGGTGGGGKGIFTTLTYSW